MQGLDAVAAIDPYGAIVRQAELMLLLKIDYGGYGSGDCQDGQDRG
jgi:hypothetical protein